MALIQFKQGKYDAYHSLSAKDETTMYLITDKQQVYLGDILLADHNVEFVSQAPSAETAKDGVIYVVTAEDGTSIVTKGQDGQIDTVGGGEASSYEPGSLTFDALNSGMVANEISPDGASSEKLATESAVQKYVDGVKTELTNKITEETKGAIVGVTQERTPDNKGTILKFQTKDESDEDISVTVKDLFLTKAEYDTESHQLKLFIQEQEEPVTVDLTELIPQSVNTKDVALAEEIVVTTNVGNFSSGDTIRPDDVADLQAFLVKMLTKDMNPTKKTDPKITITLTGAGALEVGTSFTPKWSVSTTPGEWGYKGADGAWNKKTLATGITFSNYNVSESVGEGTSQETSGQFTAFTVEDTTNYTVSATATGSDSIEPKTFVGDAYPSGKIATTTYSAKSSAVTGARKWYYGWKNGSSKIEDLEAITAAEIKGLNSSELAANKTAGAKTMTTNQMQQLILAVPKSWGYKSLEVKDTGTNLPQTSYKKAEAVQVGGVSDHSPVDYDVFYVNNTAPDKGAGTYQCTLKK